jgi:hypothetical protein
MKSPPFYPPAKARGEQILAKQGAEILYAEDSAQDDKIPAGPVTLLGENAPL